MRFLDGVLIGYLVAYGGTLLWHRRRVRQVQRVVNDPLKWN